LTGSFILIDPMRNATVAAGMISDADSRLHLKPAYAGFTQRRVTRLEQEQRAGHRAFTVCITGDEELACRLERLLFDSGYRVHALRAEALPHVAEACRVLNDAGVIAIYSSGNDAAHNHLRQVVGDANMLVFNSADLRIKPEAAVNEFYTLLQQEGWLNNDSSDS